MQCNALRINGHQCRNYATPTKRGAVCHIHRNFFVGDKAFKNIRRNASIFQTIPERNCAVRMLACPDFEWKPEYTQYIKDASESVEPFAKDEAAYIYDMAIRAGVLPPLKLPDIWYSRVKRQANVLQFCSLASADAEPVSIRVIGELLRPYFAEVEGYMAIKLLMKAMAAMSHPRNTPQQTVELIMSVWQNILRLAVKECCMQAFIGYPLKDYIATLQLEQNRYTNSIWHTGMKEFLESHIKSSSIELKKELKVKLSLLKEELVSVVFRPENVLWHWEQGCAPEDM
jgi:hypothetical protein